MSRRRLLLGALGVAALAAGITAAGDGPLAAAVGDAVAALGNDYFLLVAVGAAGVVAAAVMLFSGRSGNLQQRSMPDPEGSASAPTPGDDFDERASGVRFALPLVGRSRRRRVRERLRAAAVEAVRRSDQCSRAEAERRVANGTWTDEPEAAAFLAESSSGSLSAHVTALADGETLARRRMRRTVDAVAGRARSGSDRR